MFPTWYYQNEAQIDRGQYNSLAPMFHFKMFLLFLNAKVMICLSLLGAGRTKEIFQEIYDTTLNPSET